MLYMRGLFVTGKVVRTYIFYLHSARCSNPQRVKIEHALRSSKAILFFQRSSPVLHRSPYPCSLAKESVRLITTTELCVRLSSLLMSSQSRPFSDLVMVRDVVLLGRYSVPIDGFAGTQQFKEGWIGLQRWRYPATSSVFKITSRFVDG